MFGVRSLKFKAETGCCELIMTTFSGLRSPVNFLFKASVPELVERLFPKRFH